MSTTATATRPTRTFAWLGRTADSIARHVALALGAIIGFQILATVALFFSVNRNGWLTYQGGDQIWLVTSGWLLGKGMIGYALTGHGWPMLLAPLTWITGSSSVQLLPLTTALQVGVLAPAATLAVYDIGGRVVRELHRGRLGAGPQRFDWNGRDAAGREVPAGIYFVRLDSERIRLDAKLVKLR